jgi:hydroxymethylbilane synthase
VDTRMRKLAEQDLDAIVLAYAGLKRMGYADRVKEMLPFEIMVPPSGQGAIGIETRAANEAAELVALLDDSTTRYEVTLERAFQIGVGGGCSVPLGVNARLSGDRVVLRAVFGADDGTIIFREQAEGASDEGERIVAKMLEGLKRAQARRG